MKRLLFKVALLACLGLAYGASPLVTAWSLREAIRSGDAAYLEGKLDWDRVRTTVKGSLTQFAFDLPDPSGDDASQPAKKPGIWKRVKAYFGRGALDRFVASYVTPEGLPKLFTYRQMYRANVSGEVEPEKTLSNLPERIKGFWSRVIRAEWKSLTAFEIEVKDKTDPDRHYVGLLELRGFEWKLVELRIRSLSQQERLAASASPPALATMR